MGLRNETKVVLIFLTISALLGFTQVSNEAFAGGPAPSCSLFDLDPGAGTNFGGITSVGFSCIIDNTLKTVTTVETQTTIADSYIIFNNLDIFTDYTVTKIITNSITDGTEITSFSYELHDPDGNFNDANVPDFPCVAFPVGVCPKPPMFPAPGFSHSNDPDGLSFSQGTPIPTVARDSLVFFTELPDEFNLIDFIDWMNSGPGGHFGRICNTLTIPTLSCPVASPTTDTQTFGLRDDKISGENQPFLLRESIMIIAPCIGPGCNGQVGGIFEGVDTIALLGAAVKANLLWLIPVIGIGVGIYLVKRRF